MSDVAKKANVSKMTVSRVINHPEQVTDELKLLVFKAMKELNYRPNVAAKALARNRTQIIKLFILEEMSTVEPYYMSLLTGIARGLEKRQYSLQLVTQHSFDIGGCDGYIITGMRDQDYEWIGRLEKPVVLFGENHYGYDFIDTDNQKGIEMATKYMLDRNYQQIIFVGIDLNEPFEYSREAGYLQVMQQVQKRPQIIRVSNHSHSAEKKIGKNWSKFSSNTGFVCASDRMALGVERAVMKQQGRVPEEYGIIGHDGVFLDQVADPRLTTIRQDVTKMGEACAKMVLQKIEQAGAPQGERLFVPTLVARETTR
nr:LacI family DNA-binding transcriptional regulator [Liquorilactobacillus sicerae]